MTNQDRRKNPHNEGMMLDLMYIVIGVLVVICAVLAFLDPEKNQFLFPVIFWLAGLLNGVSGWYKLKYSGRDKKRRFGGSCEDENIKGAEKYFRVCIRPGTV